MSYGASVVNSSGFVQIDENYSNFAVLVRGTASGSGSVYVDFPAQPKPPLVFASFAAADRWLALTALTNSRATFFIYPNTGQNVAASGSFSYAICVPFEDILLPNAQFGFRVFNSGGRTIFDSQIATPRIESIHHLNLYEGDRIRAVDIAVPDRGYAPWVLASNIGPLEGAYFDGAGRTMLFGPGFRSPSNSVISVTGRTLRGIIIVEPNKFYVNPTQLIVSRAL